MPASVRQTLANRRNSKRSTGPREEGKTASRTNATTHAMTAEIGYEEDQELLEQKMVELQPELGYRGPRQAIAARRYVSALLRLERCDREESAWRYHKAQRASD
jgi:hypothetical protein